MAGACAMWLWKSSRVSTRRRTWSCGLVGRIDAVSGAVSAAPSRLPRQALQLGADLRQFLFRGETGLTRLFDLTCGLVGAACFFRGPACSLVGAARLLVGAARLLVGA